MGGLPLASPRRNTLPKRAPRPDDQPVMGLIAMLIQPENKFCAGSLGTDALGPAQRNPFQAPCCPTEQADLIDQKVAHLAVVLIGKQVRRWARALARFEAASLRRLTPSTVG